MPTLFNSLQKRDLGHLIIVAELWGLELTSKEPDPALKELSASILDSELLNETLDILPPEAKSALTALTDNAGRIPWPEFSRQFGEIREMGPGKRDREKPHRNSASPAETLFYHALLARAFFDTPGGPQEFAYLPDDLLNVLKQVKSSAQPATRPFGRPALPREKAHIQMASDLVLDNATTLLAALRMGKEFSTTEPQFKVEQRLLTCAGILRNGVPQPEQTKVFLEATRKEAHKILIDAWLESGEFNELRMIPGLVFEGEWKNNPGSTRKFLLDLLNKLPKDKWWSLSAFTQDIKETHPDFQRPAGDYNAWFIRKDEDGQYLRGFEHWDCIEGNLIQFFLDPILFMLGKVDLGYLGEMDHLSAFRVRSQLPITLEPENVKLGVSSKGLITIPRLFSRVARYQIARFCEWQEHKWEDEYRYQVTPLSLQQAQKQGLNVEQLLSLLAKHSQDKIPPAMVKALKNWDANGTEVRIQAQIVLRVSRPEILDELRKSRAGRFLGEIIGPTAVTVKDGAQSKVLAALAELGLLAEDETLSN